MDCTTTRADEKTLFEAATEYAQQGLRVFPCNDTKRPRIKGWPELATTDPEQIRKWWAKWRRANIGIATGEGSGLLVVDIDCKGDTNGFYELEAFLGEPVESLEAPRYRTPSGGAQLWFAYPVGDDDGIATKAHIGGLSIDTRANGGLCLAPPSATADGRYEWIVEPEEFDNLPHCPADLLELLREPGRPKAGSNGSTQSVIADTEGHTLETHPGAGSGLRNGLLVVLVGKWLSDNPGATWEKLGPLVLGWNERCKPPKPAALALKPAQYLWEKEQQAPRLRLDNLQAPARGPESGPPAQAGSSGPKRKKLLVRRASMVEAKPVEWLWPSHLQLKALNIIAGPEGKGKSLLAAYCAAGVSTGRSWPDGTYPPKGRVLYCSAEEDASTTVVPRLMAAGADLELIDIIDGIGEPGDSPEDALHIDLGQHLPQVQEQLQSQSDYRLCVFDTFQSVALQTEHKSNTNQKQVAQPLSRIAAEQSLTMLAIEHHSRGGLQRGNADNAILGAGLVRTARAIWHVLEDPDDDSVRLFLPGKLNNADRDSEDLGWRFAFRQVVVEMGGRDIGVPALDWLEAAGTTLNEVRDVHTGDSKGPGRPNDEFERAVEWLRKTLQEPMAASEIKAGWKAEMFSDKTIQRAKKHLLIQSTKQGGEWVWSPPPKLVTTIPADE